MNARFMHRPVTPGVAGSSPVHSAIYPMGDCCETSLPHIEPAKEFALAQGGVEAGQLDGSLGSNIAPSSRLTSPLANVWPASRSNWRASSEPSTLEC